jgi:hypothetical protein
MPEEETSGEEVAKVEKNGPGWVTLVLSIAGAVAASWLSGSFGAAYGQGQLDQRVTAVEVEVERRSDVVDKVDVIETNQSNLKESVDRYILTNDKAHEAIQAELARDRRERKAEQREILTAIREIRTSGNGH